MTSSSGNARRWHGPLRLLLALGFITSGTLHFLRPKPFVRIVPPQLPAPEVLVAVSGAAEILGALGLLLPRTRRAAGAGLILLLVAVFPANVQMAIDPEGAGKGVPAWALWARLPLQPLLVVLVWLVSRRR